MQDQIPSNNISPEVVPEKIGAHTRFSDLPELLTPDEARAVIRVSRNGLYDMLRRGDIEHVRHGRLMRIPKQALFERKP